MNVLETLEHILGGAALFPDEFRDAPPIRCSVEIDLLHLSLLVRFIDSKGRLAGVEVPAHHYKGREGEYLTAIRSTIRRHWLTHKDGKNFRTMSYLWFRRRKKESLQTQARAWKLTVPDDRVD